jgi:site-specific recombinase XerD
MRMAFDLKNYKFSVGEHRDKKVIFVTFPYNAELQKDLREKFSAAKWSASKKCWYLTDANAIRKEIGLMPKTEMGKTVISQIHPVNHEALKRMHELLLLKAYSPNTIRTYCTEFSQLLYLLKNVPVDTLTPERLRSYFLYCVKTLKLSENIIHSRMNAIKFYFDQVLKREKFFFEEIPRPKKKSLLPKVISKTDIAKIFSKIENPKHLLMLKLCYGMGLRVGEIVNLKVTNIDSKRMLVHIEAAKGKRDRYVTLPESVLDDLRNYYKLYRPKDYLFEGQFGGQYAIRSVQAVFKNAMQKAKINKSVGIHGLRHSYATHLMECGTDMVFIQKLLGHKDIKTTEIYAKVSNRHLQNVKSPLDTITSSPEQ